MFVCWGGLFWVLSTRIKQCKEWKDAEKQRAPTYSTMNHASPGGLLIQTWSERGNQNEWDDERRREQDAVREGMCELVSPVCLKET